MGIKNLSKIIKKYHTPITQKMSFYRTKKIAFDASLLIYQCLNAIRADGEQLSFNDASTSHISGMFYKVINMIEAGIKPIFVFDGKPPNIKSNLIAKRNLRRETAEKKYQEAKEASDKTRMEKYDKRKLKITPKHANEIKELLSHLGVSYTESPNEAEAFCAQLCKNGIVDYVCTEDMDALCFGAPYLLRNPKKDVCIEYSLNSILKDMEMEFDSFIDFCILLGCDYAETIKGVGPAKAELLIRKHKTIENVLKELNIVDLEFQSAKSMFHQNNPDCKVENVGVDWKKYNRDNVVEFLKKFNFSDQRISNGLERYEKNQLKKETMRLTDMFKKKK